MRTKEEILNDCHYTPQLQSRIIAEILVDIRDILNERLLEIDRGLHVISGLDDYIKGDHKPINRGKGR